MGAWGDSGPVGDVRSESCGSLNATSKVEYKRYWTALESAVRRQPH